MTRHSNLTPINKRLAKKISNLSAMDKLYWDVIRDDGVLNVGFLPPGSKLNYDHVTGVVKPELGKVPNVTDERDTEWWWTKFALEDFVSVINSATIDPDDEQEESVGFNRCTKDCGELGLGWEYQDSKWFTTHLEDLNASFQTKRLIDWEAENAYYPKRTAIDFGWDPESNFLEKKVSVRYPKTFKAIKKSETYKEIKELSSQIKAIYIQAHRVLNDDRYTWYDHQDVFIENNYSRLVNERRKLGKRIEKTFGYKMSIDGRGRDALDLKYGWAKKGKTYDVIVGSWDKLIDSDGNKYGGFQWNRRNSPDDEIIGDQLVATKTLANVPVDLLNPEAGKFSRYLNSVSHEIAHLVGLDHETWNPLNKNFTQKDTLMSYNQEYNDGKWILGYTRTDRYAIWSMLDEMMAIEVAEEL